MLFDQSNELWDHFIEIEFVDLINVFVQGYFE